ncbi:cytochrome C oxidase subunit IV [Pseudoduganella sp. DS3]|uniref:Cytochrome C oxidase subunit IV n=1 Tax=Pseudoduganella guangdongensis TaxID=2692179 RepID=A0A6N9HIE6_9BURK|nr:cytochrome C oxidase subunit IV family protein [Pseudoduganella guangdongensis]MYN03129.1 cytochrome C oxidase subunit IV [Pseudoduganella guangdongensis]
MSNADAGSTHQQHPIGTYVKVWILLFVLSFFSYLVDFFHVQGVLRWGLILVLMVLKAGFIVAVFMHMKWERLALISAIVLPPLAILVLVAMMGAESGYVHDNRIEHFAVAPLK